MVWTDLSKMDCTVLECQTEASKMWNVLKSMYKMVVKRMRYIFCKLENGDGSLFVGTIFNCKSGRNKRLAFSSRTWNEM